MASNGLVMLPVWFDTAHKGALYHQCVYGALIPGLSNHAKFPSRLETTEKGKRVAW
jgi:hypothetical protein